MTRHVPAPSRAFIARAFAVVVVLGALTGCDQIRSWFKEKAPDIKFAPYAADYRSKVDLARVERQFPLGPTDLNKLTPENVASLNQEQLDQLYARLTAGPIPDGAFDGKMLFARGGSGQFRAAEIAGGFTGFALHLKGLELEVIGETLWKGKVFYRDQRLLRNRIEDFDLLKRTGLVEGDPKPTTVGGKQTWLLFPAKLYCGQSLFDSRRESIIIDYFFSDELPGYQERPDFLAGRRGLRVRDEIRMVRPGFYLGRAYTDKMFLLNFTMYNKEIADRDGDAFTKTGQVNQDCWTGTQQRVTTAGN